MAQLPLGEFEDGPRRPRGAPDPQAGASSAGGEPTGRRRGGRPLTVSELAGMVKGVLADGFPGAVRVVGEISNFTSRTHWFFSLKDAGAAIRCVCFASAARKVGFAVKDGMQVVATGRVDFFPGQGSLQLYVDRLEPVGVGALELKLRQLIEDLRGLGYFDEGRKKQLPVFPQGVAVVTSRTGAALQDVINTARRRWAGCRLYLLDVHVQGAEAAPEVARAIEVLGGQGERLGIDAIILTRGGGSIEDLWAFNERVVADAVFRCPVPIVAAIGHETDTTVAELVADVRASTPTQAAMMLVPDQEAWRDQVLQMGQRLHLLAKRQVGQDRQRLEALARHPMFRRPELTFQPLRQRLENLAQALHAALPRLVQDRRRMLVALAPRLEVALPHLAQRRRQEFESLAPRLAVALPRRVQVERAKVEALLRQLAALNPTNVLQRGYSYTLGADGHVLRSVKAVQPAQRITTVLADGRISSIVEGQGKGQGTGGQGQAAGPTPAPARAGATGARLMPRRRGGGKDEGPMLF